MPTMIWKYNSRNSGKCCTKSRVWFRENAIMVATMLAVIIGVALGFGIRLAEPSTEVIIWLSIWGELFMRMLKMIILPLTICCLVIGVGSMDSTASGKLGGLTLAYIFSTHVISVVIGLVLVVSIQPGAGFHDQPPGGTTGKDLSYTDVFSDLLRNLIPENLIQACIQTAYTSVSLESITKDHNMTRGADSNIDLYVANSSMFELNVSGSVQNDYEDMETIRKLMYRDKMNIIGIVVLSLVFGVSLSAAGEAGKPLYKVMVSLHDVVFIVMKVIMWYSPIGIASLIIGALCRVDDISNAMYSVGLMVATATAGCLILQLVVLPLIFVALYRRNPFSFMLGIADAVMAGMASTASVAAMPYLISGLPTKFKLDKRVVQFAVPIHCTINRDGSLLYVAVACLFCAQSYGISLSFGEITVFGLLASVMIIAVASVPSSSVMVVIMLCSAFNVPINDRLGLIMAVDWFLDRLRTSTNIVSHGFGCAIINKFAERFLENDSKEMDHQEPTGDSCTEYKGLKPCADTYDYDYEMERKSLSVV